VRVVAEPSDAEIAVDGRFAATGTLERRLEIGRSVVITAAREGFHEAVLELDVVEGSGGTYRLVLEPNPILMRLSVTDAPMTGSLVTDPRRIVGIDRNGTIIIYDRLSNAIKSIPTEQHTVNSTPVLADDRLYFIGGDRFFTVDVDAGNLLYAARLDDPAALPGGRKPLPFHERGLYTDAGRLVVFDRPEGQPLQEIPIPDGAVMSPVAFRDVALIVNAAGMLLAVDESGRLEPFMPDPILPSAAILAVVEAGRLAVLSGDGALVCVDLERRRVVWESRMPLNADPDAPLSMEFSPDVLYVTNGEFLFAWLAATGEVLFPAVEGVSSPSIYMEGLLAYGTLDGRLVVADGFSGEPLRVLELGERITVRPWLEDGNIVVGTEQGSIFLINPEAIR
jgi:outer membrane protein assembly factor BamB